MSGYGMLKFVVRRDASHCTTDLALENGGSSGSKDVR